jgi:hypothetical protein
MRLLDRYILYSSVFAMFTEAFKFHYIIDLKLFYLIIGINFLLLSINKKLTISKNIFIVLAFLSLHGIVNFLLFSNPIKSLIAQLLGITICSLFYYNFIKIYGKEVVFRAYLKVAFIVAVIAIPMFYLNINAFAENRLNGIMSEPAHYAAIMLPAIYFFLRKKKYVRMSIVLITVVLSKSSIGFIGLSLILFIPLIKVKYFMKYSLIVFGIIAIGGYYLSTVWNEPIDENQSNKVVRRLKETQESLSSLKTGKFNSYTNLSTYAFLSNTFITKEIFTRYPLGTGIGSYPHQYDKNYSKMSPPKYLIDLKQSKINRTDANSLFLRMLSDLGIFAILIFIYFFYRSFKLFSKDTKIIAQSTFFYLLIKLIREGHYFPPEFYFFLFIFLKEFDEDITHS